MQTQSSIPGTVALKVTYDSKSNTCMLTSPSGNAIVFTPIYLLSVVSQTTIDFFGNCEHAAQWHRHGVDIQEFTAILPKQVMLDCYNLANGEVINLNA